MYKELKNTKDFNTDEKFALKGKPQAKKKSNFSFSKIFGTGKLKKDDAIKEVMQSVNKNMEKN